MGGATLGRPAPLGTNGQASFEGGVPHAEVGWRLASFRPMMMVAAMGA